MTAPLLSDHALLNKLVTLVDVVTLLRDFNTTIPLNTHIQQKYPNEKNMKKYIKCEPNRS